MAGHTFAGIGPKGHRREDRELHQRICDALEQHAVIDASGIEVLVDGGEVFLSGTAFSAEDASLAEQIAGGTAGARTVYNRLQLFSAGPTGPESNLATESTTDGAVSQTPNGGYDPMS